MAKWEPEALQQRLERAEATSPRLQGWRSVFDRGRREELEAIDEHFDEVADLRRVAW